MIQPLAAACKVIDCFKLYIISEIKSSYMLLMHVSIPQVDYDRRRLIAPNHTCTHMLNFALREVHGNHVEDWVNLVNSLQKRALSSRLVIPLIYGVDVVHGHNNVSKTTIFPHNIGFAATRDPALVKRIGAAIALEVRAIGIQYSINIIRLEAIDFGRRMTVKQEFQKTENAPQPNAVFDESSNFLIYATLLGIKIVNLHTNILARILGKGVF